MTTENVTHRLEWKMNLTDTGYTVHELVETYYLVPRRTLRWGWIVNASASVWVAHVGDWGQADIIGLPSPSLDSRLKTFDINSLVSAKEWVENEIASQWVVNAVSSDR